VPITVEAGLTVASYLVELQTGQEWSWARGHGPAAPARPPGHSACDRLAEVVWRAYRKKEKGPGKTPDLKKR